ncbi:MAG TPA: hypothetical protein DCZ69_13925, partial [Syntrophobacteraceae bacterium]|nr:hypothetical protein [Syntrophobacteraceae bacterium]
MKNSIVALLALVLPAIPASGQWTTGADLGYVVDDNSFNNYLQISDRVTVFSLHGGYDWETEQSSLGLSYSGDVSAFDVNPSRTHYEHNAELSYARLFGEAETTLLTAGANYMLRDNRDEFTVYDHTQWSLHLNLRHLVSEISSLRFGYQFRSASFTELPDFDYMEHATFAQIGWAFPSRTSIIVQGDLNYKSYVTPNVDTTVNTPTGSGYHRARESQSTPGVTQLIGTVKIGQGFGGTTGLSLMGQYQLSIEKETRYLSFSDGTITDDELFDDHYGYEGPLASLMLTQLPS